MHSGSEGGVLYFKDGQVRSSYTTADGLGKGHVAGFDSIAMGALWAATREWRAQPHQRWPHRTLTTNNGLPCDTIHWSIEDDDRSLWLYTACGLVRIARTELDAWIADPKRRIETTLWDAADGVRLASTSPAYFNPPVAKSTDGKLWFVGERVSQVVDPHHLAFNKVPPPVHIEQIIADHKSYWQNLPGLAVSHLRLPARIRDLTIDYTALSLAAPEKVHFKYKLEGQDSDWREVVNDREVQYSNLASRTLPLSRDCEQQQRRVERAGRYAGVLHCPGVLPDKLVSRSLRGSLLGVAVGGVSVARPAAAAGVQLGHRRTGE